MSRTRRSATVAALSLTLLACSAAQPARPPRPGRLPVVAQLGGPPVAAPPFGGSPRPNLPGVSPAPTGPRRPTRAAAGPPSSVARRDPRRQSSCARSPRQPATPTCRSVPATSSRSRSSRSRSSRRSKVRIPMKGTITLPLLGQIRATGLSPLELQDRISDLLQRSTCTTRRVSVFVHEHTSQRVSVMGSVRKGASTRSRAGFGWPMRWRWPMGWPTRRITRST